MSLLTNLRAALDVLNARKSTDYYTQRVAYDEQIYAAFAELTTILLDPLQAASVSEVTMGVGQHTFNLGANNNKRPQVGDRAKMAHDVNNLMYGYVVSHNPVSGACVIEVDSVDDIRGSGTYDEWAISFAVGDEGPPGPTYWTEPATEIDDTDGTEGDPYAAADKQIVKADATGDQVFIQLPADGRVMVSDVKGQSHLNPIAVLPPSGETIMNLAADEAFEIDMRWATFVFRRSSDGNWSVE